MSQMTAKEAEKPLAVPRALEELKTCTRVLAGLMDRLETRLFPVLAPVPPVGESCPSSPMGPHDPSSLRVTDHLVELNGDLTMLGARIERLLNGLEI